jgi:aryl-alcohol dehydrogenase-like predicted oxidoreductase
MTVVGSASLLQGRLRGDLPAEVAARFPGCGTDAQRALQFARSAPGLAAALVGMSRVPHVEENLAVASLPKLPRDTFEAFFRRP